MFVNISDRGQSLRTTCPMLVRVGGAGGAFLPGPSGFCVEILRPHYFLVDGHKDHVLILEEDSDSVCLCEGSHRGS